MNISDTATAKLFGVIQHATDTSKRVLAWTPASRWTAVANTGTASNRQMGVGSPTAANLRVIHAGGLSLANTSTTAGGTSNDGDLIMVGNVTYLQTINNAIVRFDNTPVPVTMSAFNME